MDLKSFNYYLEELVGSVERRKPVDPSQDPQFIDVKSLIKQQKTLDPYLPKLSVVVHQSYQKSE